MHTTMDTPLRFQQTRRLVFESKVRCSREGGLTGRYVSPVSAMMSEECQINVRPKVGGIMFCC